MSPAVDYRPWRVCYARCYPCMFGDHYDPPQWHTWADAEDIEHAVKTGQEDPSTSKCGCPCADVVLPERLEPTPATTGEVAPRVVMDGWLEPRSTRPGT